MAYGTNVVSSALTCVWCLSVWCAAALAALDRDRDKGVFSYIRELLALSAGAIFIEETLNKLDGDK